MSQSQKLQRAKFHFLKRNKEAFEAIFPDYDAVREKERSAGVPDEEIDEIFAELFCPMAVIDMVDFDDCKPYCRACERFEETPEVTEEEKRRFFWTGRVPPLYIDIFEKLYLEELLKDSEEIIKYLVGEKTSRKMLVAIDLERSTDVIMEEIKQKIRQEKRSLSVQSRMKWLSIADDLLMVWDSYSGEGKKPGTLTFAMLSKKFNRPISTIKSQFFLAYKKIYGVPYDPDFKYSTEEKKAQADKLCAQCPHGAACYRKSGDWFPCVDYVRISGKDRVVDTSEYKDERGI